MFEHLFIAEKPSLAGEIAKTRAKQMGVQATKGQSHWTVGDDAVTWVIGHFYDTAPPDFYDAKYKNWSLGDLPIIPSRWKILPKSEHAGQLRSIQQLLKQARKIVNLGDPEREGQLLIDELLVESGKNPFGDDVLRLWVQDLSEGKKLEALQTMFPNAQKQGLYEAAVGRQRADWLLGMNMTRLYTGLARKAGMSQGAVSVGRVQTPTLRLVVDRDREIAKFKAVDHYLPSGLFVHADGKFKASWIIPADHEGLDPDGRLIDKGVAGAIAQKVAGKTGSIESFEVKAKSKSPPLAFSLSSLQKELSAKYSFTLDKSLELAQSLYEKKLTSYPRTDSDYLPTGILKEDAPGIMANLGKVDAYAVLAQNADLKLKSPAWNDAKVSDHYGIIPTSEASAGAISALSGDERKVFDIIAKRFIAQFYPDHRWNSTTVIVAIEGERFKGTGRIVTEKGWKTVYETATEKLEKEEDEDEDEQTLPKMSKGDGVKAETVGLDSKRTSPPAHFTDGTLVDAMKSIHRFVKDSEVKKLLKEHSGIGTEATRANILKGLIEQRKFLARKGKYVISTPVGQSVIDMVAEEVKDPALTAVWEEQLERVNKRELPLDSFVADLAREVSRMVEAMRGATVKMAGTKTLPGHGDLCPNCGKGHLTTRTAQTGKLKGKSWLSCDAYDKDDANSCKYAKWPDDGGKPIEKLEGDGKLCPKCGVGHMVTRAVREGASKGKRFLSCDAYDKANPSSCRHSEWEQQQVEPLPGHGGVCPSCKKGVLETKIVMKEGPNKGKRFLLCTEFKRDVPGACQHFDFPKDVVEALPGAGKACPKCGKGHMVTRMVREGTSKGKRFLSCDNYQKGSSDSCSHSEWPQMAIEPLDGDGDTCSSCQTGKMRTRMVLKDGPNKGKRYLSCDNYKAGSPTNCSHSVWPPELKTVRGEGAPAGRGSKFEGFRKTTGR